MSNKIKLNDVDYIINITINNGGLSTHNNCVIPCNLIYELTLIDNIYEPFYTGVLKINNNNNALSRIKQAGNQTGYIIRGDGFDVVTIEMYEANAKNPIKQRYIFSISKSYTLQQGNNLILVLELQDYMKTILSNRSSFINTSPTDVKFRAQCSNDERSQYTGTIIYNILKDTFGTNSINSSMWDNGHSRIFYTAGCNETLLDTLNAIYKLHQSENALGDVCFLTHNPIDEKWRLNSLAALYSLAIDHYTNKPGYMHSGTILIPGDSNDNNKYAVNGTTMDGNVSSHSGIAMRYGFLDMELRDVLLSKVLYNYNLKDKSFKIDSNTGNLKNINKFIDTFYSLMLLPGTRSNIPSTLSRESNLIYNNAFNLYESANDSISRNSMIYKFFILGSAVEFETKGNLQRQSGTFVTVTGPQTAENEFDDKLYGIYWLTSCIHNVIGSNYTTTYVGVKPFVNNMPDNYKEIVYG